MPGVLALQTCKYATESCTVPFLLAALARAAERKRGKKSKPRQGSFSLVVGWHSCSRAGFVPVPFPWFSQRRCSCRGLRKSAEPGGGWLFPLPLSTKQEVAVGWGGLGCAHTAPFSRLIGCLPVANKAIVWGQCCSHLGF